MQPVMERWGEPVRKQIAEHLDQLPVLMDNQQAYSQAILKLIEALPFLPETPTPETEEEAEEMPDATGLREEPEKTETETPHLTSAGADDLTAEQGQMLTEMLGDGPDEAAADDSDDFPPEEESIALPPHLRRNSDYHAFGTEFDEIVRLSSRR